MINHLDIGHIVECYREEEKNGRIERFNIFTLTSDLYYRENYHSDILSAFLRYKDAETRKYILLEAFVEMLNTSRGDNSKISIDNYPDPEIKREAHRIDILIKDKNSKNCIIIENKLNDAPDMPRQLPRYYNEMKKEGKRVDAIVYLTREPNVYPDWLGWEKEEVSEVRDLLIALPAYNSKDRISLVTHWINPCLMEVNDLDVLSSLRQYGRLLEKMCGNKKQVYLMTELLSRLQNKDQNSLKIEDLIALQDIVIKMPMVMAQDLRSELTPILKQKNAKYMVTGWQPNSCVINIDKENAIFVYCEFREDKGYSLGIADFSRVDRTASWFDPSQLGEDYRENLQSVINSDNHSDFKFQFGFYEKSKVIELINKLCEQYSAYIKK